MCRYYVRPTQLRLKKEYIIYYHTWTWVVFTGNQFSLIFLFCFLVTRLGTTGSKMCPMLYFLRLNRSFEPKWLFVLIHDLEWKKPNIKQNRNMSHMSSHVNKMILHRPFRVGKTRNSWNIIVLINPVLADFRAFTPIWVNFTQIIILMSFFPVSYAFSYDNFAKAKSCLCFNLHCFHV